MKAIVCEQYGPPEILQYKEIERPDPKDDEVLVSINASSVNAFDWRILRADPFPVRFVFGLFKPKFKVLGTDISGCVEAIGKNVRRLRPGDEVFGDISECGCGGFAEYVCADENALALKPAGVTFEAAAATPFAGVTSLQALRDKGHIMAGMKVLINGASGGVGTCAVQIAKSYNTEVTAVCSSSNLDTALSIGADHVIDYTQEDFTASGKQYDLIFAANGYHPILHYRRALKPKGIYVMAGGSMVQILQANLLGPWISMAGDRKMASMVMKPKNSDLIFIKKLLENGNLSPVIDRQYPLHETAEAIKYLEQGHARGKVVITIRKGESSYG